MVCIYCSDSTQVINSRLQRRANQTWRRRKCSNCGAIFTTQERYLESRAYLVQGLDNNLTPLSRDIILLSVYNSCKHREDPLEDASALADTVMSNVVVSAKDGVIKSSGIVHECLKVLGNFDKAAAVHYRVFHK